jgi:hypothetical protein
VGNQLLDVKFAALAVLEHTFLDLSGFLEGLLDLCLLHLLINMLLFAYLMEEYPRLMLSRYHLLMILTHFLQIFPDHIFLLLQLHHPLFLATLSLLL